MPDQQNDPNEIDLSGVLPVRAPGTPSPIRVLVIDLGTNSFHAVIVDAHANGSFTVLDSRKELVDLGAAGLSRHWLSEDDVGRGLGALNRIKSLGEGWGVEDHLAFATSAIREARNGGAFVDRVRKELGIRVRPISGEREAGLIYEGVRLAVEIPNPSLIVDIGGGSTEFVIATSEQSILETSLKIGAARLTEEFVDGDPVSEGGLERMQARLAKCLEPVFAVARAHGVETLIGSSGAMHNLAQLVVDGQGDDVRTPFQQLVEASWVRDVAARLIASTRFERSQLGSIDEKRVDQIVAASVLVRMLVDELGIRRFRVSPYALREGMVVHFIRLNHDRLEQLAPFGNVRRRSVNELGFRCGWEVRHSLKVAELSLQLFDGLTSLHGFDGKERELLEYAALLHDVGYHISRSDHHKHSFYMIAHADLNGFVPDEITTMALVARYHAGALPRNSHASLRNLDDSSRDRVLKLAAMLRIAEGLDRGHFQNVQSLNIRQTDSHVALYLETQSDPEMDIWGAERGTDLFEQVFGLEVRILAAEDSRQI